ncbi:MAG: ATP-binding protein [Pseudomonadota bacterium]
MPGRFFRRPALFALSAAIGLAIVVALIALPRLERLFTLRMGENARAALALTIESLRSELDRAAPLPQLLAERPILAELLRDPENQGLLPFANEQLRQSAIRLGVSDIYLLDAEGQTIAASNYRRNDTFIGRSFGYRPYFLEALAGGPGRFHALGTTSGRRGYFFAAPVLDQNQVGGVLAVKITLDHVEDSWREGMIDVIVTDQSNVIFLSGRPAWHFRTMGGLSPGAVAAIERTRQYPTDRLEPLPYDRRAIQDGIDYVSIDNESFVGVTGLIAAAGWRVTVLNPVAPAMIQAQQVTALLVLGVLSLSLVAALIQQRRARLLERLEVQAQAQATLEARVTERTEALRQEVEDRRTAEEELRRAQADLIQAGKLAALGQMSATLSHEFNQPLAAVKSYADNAQTFLDRGQADEARRNIGLISQMADRMAAISKHLRNFARRPQDKTGAIPLLATVDEAIALMQPRLDTAGAILSVSRPDREVWVNGGRVRLAQVMVNLMSNALDAMEGCAAIKLDLTVSRTPQGWRVDLRDYGPGIGADGGDPIFDPFFSTKGPGSGAGLGLGLSISYNIMRDFGGALSATNHAGGGAIFSAELREADAPQVAAQ